MAKTCDYAHQWFNTQGWKPFTFQKAVWAAVKRGQSGVLHANTGAGKTYALWFAALNRYASSTAPGTGDAPRRRKPVAPPLTVLWITPMRALAADSARAL
ncbi:DEAD/DEAH box helicase, partial [Pseudomonas sp. CF161]|uniref:DEAD/DEAH box helicase n=1 Tax=Pseudomonas sp. CF161 TaxID=911241 RepID=UPI0003550755